MFKRFPILVLSLIVMLTLTLSVLTKNTFANCSVCHDSDIKKTGLYCSNEGLGSAAVEKDGFQVSQIFEVKIGLYDKNSPGITTCSIFEDLYDVASALTQEKPKAPGTTQNRSLTNEEFLPRSEELTTLAAGILSINLLRSEMLESRTAIQENADVTTVATFEGGAEQFLLFNVFTPEDVRLSANGFKINDMQIEVVTRAGFVVSHIENGVV